MSTSNGNYAIHKVSLKRTRQACGPCRRKKARCPGEKPACSLCQRLGQRCTYGSQAALGRTNHPRTSFTPAQERNLGDSSETSQPDPSSSQRFQRIEERLDEMASFLEQNLSRSNTIHGPNNESERRHSYHDQTENSAVPAPLNSQDESRDDLLWALSPTEMKIEVDIYLTYFHDQPYCVFCKDWLVNRAYSLPPEIAFPMLALTSRLSPRSHETIAGGVSTTEYYAKKAWDILSNRHREGKYGLSFLQGTCLMAQVDFSDGRSKRGYTSVALGLQILQSAGLNKNKYASALSRFENEQRRRLVWAFFMLDRSYNASRDHSLCLSDKHFTLPFPAPDTEETRRGNDSQASGSLHDGPGKQGEKVDHGIMGCLLRLFSLWGKATEYVFEPIDKNSLPPWQAESALAVLESEWLQFETHFADTHRYLNVNFQRRAREDPQSRTYLSTWMFVQFLFHSIQCLLRHPFVLVAKLRHIDRNISTTFLQKSYEGSLLHARWISRFIKEMSEVDFRLYDPFLGYLAAIAATIHLEHTASKNEQVASVVKTEFQILLDFITHLSTQSASMKVLAQKVNDLAVRHKNIGSLYYANDAYSGALGAMPTSSNLPRMSAEAESLMWDILDFSSSSGSAGSVDLGDLVPVQDKQLEEQGPFSMPGGAISTSGPPEAVSYCRNEEQRDSTMLPHSTSQGMPFLYGRDSDSITEDPMSEWSLSNRNVNFGLGTAIPDIPDWMILGGYMAEHL